MIEELKELVAVIGSLPQMALWVAIGFWAYKVIIVGSIYGVIRYVVGQLFDYLRLRKNPPPVVVPIQGEIDGIVITAHQLALLVQIKRMRGIRSQSDSYIHEVDVDWLREQIDAEIERKQKAKK